MNFTFVCYKSLDAVAFRESLIDMKCSCTACGKHIEYEAAAAGSEISCPHCGAATRLVAYSAAAPPPVLHPTVAQPVANRAVPWIIVIVIAAVAVPIVLAVIGLLAAIAIPNFVKARQASQRAACIANLRQIDVAKKMWATQNNKAKGDQPSDSDLFGAEKYIRQNPVCPAGGTYSIGPVGTDPTCTIPGHQL
jgi:competence protein ComGC